MNREELILLLAQYVIQSNVDGYKQYCEDVDCSPTALEFATFSVGYESIRETIIDCLEDEIVTKVVEIQKLISPILFDKE